MTIGAIVVLVAVILLAMLINGIEDSNRCEKMSFRETMDLVDVPIVTFHQGGTKLNLILDTGSSYSHISQKAAENLTGNTRSFNVSMIAVGGDSAVNTVLDTVLTYKDKEYAVTLCIGTHMDDVCEALKEAHGVQVHGILGTDFLNKHQYVLDFDELVAYSKKKA